MWLRTKTVNDVARLVLATIIVSGYFAVTIYMVMNKDSDAKILIGALAGAFMTIVGYNFGTTTGSERKTELLAQAQPIKEESKE